MKKDKGTRQNIPSVIRLGVAIVLVLCLLIGIIYVIPWHFPYDRLDYLYGLEVETIPVGHRGGRFTMYCAHITGSPKAKLMVNGKVYSEAEYTGREQFTVALGEELFTQPGRLDLALRLTFTGGVSLRTNTVSVYVTE